MSAFWLALLLGASSQAQVGPSFPCKAGQSALEAAICASPVLSAEDREMAALYAANRISAFGTGESNELSVQRGVLKDMQACAREANAAKVRDCLDGAYTLRNYALALSAVTRSPDLALPVIRRSDPVFAPIAEAMALWASEPVDADWRAPGRAAKRAWILALLKPIMTGLLNDADEMRAKESLAIDLKAVDDVLLSDRHFAAFLNVLGPVLDNDPFASSARAISCAAVVKHPALLGATAAAYSSTLDNGVFDTDCEETLPALPAFTALDGKVRKSWPQCEGTIRFAAYRAYAVTVASVRLGQVEHDPKAELFARSGVTAGDVAAARGELTTYYARYLGKASGPAGIMAADAVSALLRDAHECG